MTAIMRAAPRASGPKLLRIGIVRQGRMLDEQLIERRTHVTIGSSERATVVVSGAKLGASKTLFQARAGGYRLNDIAGMSGRISTSDGVSSLEQLRADMEGDGAQRGLRLDPSARGRVTIGDTTILFQFVTPPPARKPIPLPAAVQTSLFGDIDWFTTVVAAFSFLLHFFMVALIYSDWMDQVVDSEVAIAQLVESVQSLPPPPALEKPTADASATPSAKATAAPEAKAAKRGQAGRNNGGRSGARGRRAGGSDARAAEIASQLRALELDTLTALGAEGPSTKAVTSDGEVPVALLDDQARSRRGADADDPGGLGIGDGPGADTMIPGDNDRRLSDVGVRERGEEDATKVGVVKKTDGPRGSAIVAPPAVAVSKVANANAVVAGMRGRFRRCYQRGLDDIPTLAGAVTLVARIGPNGEVQSVGGGGGGLGVIVPCLKAVVSSGAFSPPSGSSAVISIPIQFVRQQ